MDTATVTMETVSEKSMEFWKQLSFIEGLNVILGTLSFEIP